MNASFFSLNPFVLASHREWAWTLPQSAQLDGDGFGFAAEGSGALLMLGVHLMDERPWIAARHPLMFPPLAKPGSIDLEAKRIVGKRIREEEEEEKEEETSHPIPKRPLAPIPNLLRAFKDAGHEFDRADILWPDTPKVPGKLLPRKLTAKVELRSNTALFQATARNFSEISQCFHAELAALLYLGSLLPSDIFEEDWHFKLHTTLKPCRMCAAFLFHIATKPGLASFTVTYDEHDPGPLAASTRLDRNGYRFSSTQSWTVDRMGKSED